MYTNRILLSFDSGHRLLGYGGKCEVPHGHTFSAEIILNSETINEKGFVIDFVELKDKVGKWINDNWDHSFLVNDQDEELIKAFELLREKKLFAFRGQNPTVEVMSKYLYEQVRRVCGDIVSKVRIWHSPTQYAEYSEG